MKSAVGRATTYGVASLVPRAISFALLPLYAHNMTPSDYGLLATIDVFSLYLSITVNAGFSNALLRFYYDKDDQHWRKTVFLTCLCAAFTLGLGVLVLAEGGLQIAVWLSLIPPSVRIYLGIATVTVFLEVINAIVWALYRLQKRAPRALAIAAVRASIAIPLTVYLIAGLKLAVLGFLLSNLAVAAAIVALFSAPEIKRNWAKPQFGLLRSLVGFSLPYIPIGFVEAFLNSMGVLSLTLVGGLSSTGLYAIGTKIASIITLCYAPINTVWMPMMYERANKPEGRKFYSESTSYVLLFLATVVVGVVSLGGPLLIAMTPSQYAMASVVIVPLAIGTGIYSLRTNVRVGFTLARKTRLLPFYTIIPLAVGFPLTILLSWLWGIYGTAFGVSLTMIGTILITGWRSRKFFDAPYEWGRIVRLATAVTICTGLTFVVPSDRTLPRIGIMALFFVLLLVLRIVQRKDIGHLWASTFPNGMGMKRNAVTD